MKRIAVIGLGTLGGALCKNISAMESIDELVIIDYDTIESKNVHNSVYNASHIGETKVDALKEIIEEDVHVVPLIMKYKEGKTSIPECDLVVDCRDIVCDRGKEIDVRLYISGKILIIDCRKNVRTQYNYEGSYRRHLSKSELNKAGFFASQIICSKELDYLKGNNTVQRIDLNLLPSIISEAMKKRFDNHVDIIYEAVDGSERLQCLTENIQPIMKLNRGSDVNVYVGERESEELNLLKPFRSIDSLFKTPKTKYAVIPHNTLRNTNDLRHALTEIVRTQHNLVNFIVTVRELNGETFVELLEETGAA